MARPTKAQLVEFGLAVNKRRADLGLSQTKLAELAGISTSQANNVEQGHNHPSLHVYFEICRILKMPRPPFAPETGELPE